MNIYNTEDFNNIFNVINENFNSFFNNSFLLRLSARYNFNNFANLLTLLTFDQLYSIDKENN